MKKTLLSLTIAMFSISMLSAQEDSKYGFYEKDVFLSGNIDYSNEKSGDLKNSFFSFSPTVGFFVSENLALNGGFIFSSSKSDVSANAINTIDKRTSFGGTLGASYFFTPQNQFSFLLNLNTYYENVKFERISGVDTNVDQFGIAFSPGINYFVSERIALQMRLGSVSYISVTNGDVLFNDVKRFGIDLDLASLGFGAVFKL